MLKGQTDRHTDRQTDRQADCNTPLLYQSRVKILWTLYLLNQRRVSTKPYTNVSYSRVTNWLDFERHGLKHQGHRRRFQKWISDRFGSCWWFCKFGKTRSKGRRWRSYLWDTLSRILQQIWWLPVKFCLAVIEILLHFEAKALIPGESNKLGEWLCDWVTEWVTDWAHDISLWASWAAEGATETKFGTRVA